MGSQRGVGAAGLAVLGDSRLKSRALIMCALLVASTLVLLAGGVKPAGAQAASLVVTKSASPTSRAEPGGRFTFTVNIANNDTQAVTILDMTDSVYGDIFAAPGANDSRIIDADNNCDDLENDIIAASSSVSCTFAVNFTGNGGDTSTNAVSVTVSPDVGDDRSDTSNLVTISITDEDTDITTDLTVSPTSRAAPGGDFTYTVRVTNNGSETVILTTLTSGGSNLNGRGTCLTGGSINAGATFTCSFTEGFTGSSGDTKTTTVTAVAADDDNAADTDSSSDSVTVSLDGGTGGFTVTNTASPQSRPVPGGSFTFSIVVSNATGGSVNLTTLSDNVYGNLDGRGTCDVPQTVSNNSSYSCSFSVDFTGNTARTQTNTVTATGTRTGGSTVTDTDDETIALTGSTTPPAVFPPLNPFLPIGSGSGSNQPIIITNNNSSTSSSSASAVASGGAVAVPTPTPPTPQTLVRTGVEALPMAAAGMAILLLGLVMLAAGNRKLILESSSK